MGEDTERERSEPGENDGPAQLWQRIREHKIVQWAVAYVAIAYGIQLAVILTSESLDWPHAVERITMIVLALGLPIVITLAWYHGAKASRRISTGEFSILAVLLVGVSLLFYIFVRPSEQIAARPAVAGHAMTAVAPGPKPAADSVAVLPFLNLSGDPKEEYFSDGMTEELTSALAEIPNLPVVGRTSAFAFKGKNEDLRTIGRTLHAAYLLEGSVRQDGNEVRITAQLIKAETGDHVWTDSYDRELKGIFAVQQDVAKAIAGALQVPLGLKQGEMLVTNRTNDTQSYEDYLRALALYRSRGQDTALTAPITLLEQVVTRQPNYAPAWALLAQAYVLAPTHDPAYITSSAAELRRVADADFLKAEAAARRAIQLDPRNADAYTGLGLVQELSGKWLGAEQSFKRALSFDPLNPDTLQEYSVFLYRTGQFRQAVAMRDQLFALDPLVPAFNVTTAAILSAAGDNAKALAVAQQSNGVGAGTIAEIYAAMGRYKEAADLVVKLPHENYPPGAVEAAARLLRMAPAQAPRENVPYLAPFSFVFAYVGLPEHALEWQERNADAGYFNFGFTGLWNSNFTAVRKTERFKALVRKMGLVDYWRAKGWPEFCHSTTGDNFACN